MCDAMREPPVPGTDLFMYWQFEPYPEVGDECTLPLGAWTLRVRITKVKDAVYYESGKHVSMIVIG